MTRLSTVSNSKSGEEIFSKQEAKPVPMIFRCVLHDIWSSTVARANMLPDLDVKRGSYQVCQALEDRLRHWKALCRLSDVIEILAIFSPIGVIGMRSELFEMYRM